MKAWLKYYLICFNTPNRRLTLPLFSRYLIADHLLSGSKATQQETDFLLIIFLYYCVSAVWNLWNERKTKTENYRKNTMQDGSANFVVCRSSYWNLHHNSRSVHQLSSKFVNNNKYSISDLCRLSFCRLYKKARQGKPNGFTKYFVGNLISISVIQRYNVVFVVWCSFSNYAQIAIFDYVIWLN